MSFKRTSCALHEQMMDTEFNTCDVVCLGPTSAEQETVQPLDTADDISVVTFYPCIPPNTADEQFATLLSSPTSPESPSYESTYVSVQEVDPLQKLVARDFNCSLLINTETIQDKQLLVCQESGSTNLDLRSERNFETGIDNAKENSRKKVQNDCDRCTALQKITEVKDAKITELTKRLNDLTEKHKMFIVSNCQLNEENDCLKIENERLKLQLGSITFENSQLRSDKDSLVKQLAAKENQWRERSRIGSSSACPLTADPSNPNSSNLCEKFSSVIRSDLQEAIILSHQQKSDVQRLQEKITSQNEMIKTLCSQLQKMKGSGKHSLPSEHCQGINIAAVPRQEKLSSRVQKQLVPDRFSAALTEQADATRVPQKNIDEDNSILLVKDIADDENLCSRGVNCFHAPDTSSRTKTQQKTQFVASNSTFQLQCKDVKSIKAGQQFTFGQNLGNNIEEGSSTLHPTDAGIHTVSVASPTESLTTMVQTPYVQNRLLCTEIVACPFCGQEFLGSRADFQWNFETHIAKCTGLGDRQCPMCLKSLPRLSQAEFENHVNDHFVPEFEVLAP